jgi:hypothetical protein
MLPFVRAFISIVAGLVRVPAGRFGVLSLIGTVIYATVLSSIGYALGSAWESVNHGLTIVGYILFALIVIAIVGFVIYRLRAFRREARLKAAAPSPGDPASPAFPASPASSASPGSSASPASSDSPGSSASSVSPVPPASPSRSSGLSPSGSGDSASPGRPTSLGDPVSPSDPASPRRPSGPGRHAAPNRLDAEVG